MGGDFNAVLNIDDRVNGNPVTASEIEDFQNYVNDNALQEIKAIGVHFTWHNNQEGNSKIYSNIDRWFANVQWMIEHSSTVVERLEKGISDHCPQMLQFGNLTHHGGLFRFYNVLAEHESFLQLVRTEWQNVHSSILLEDIWVKCKRLKSPPKQINSRWFLKTSEIVQNLR